jgi:pimeloyl-ACP methyl ester carboxylesterase
VYLNGHGISADAQPGGPIEKLSRSGFPVLALDLRGMGETAPGKLSSSGRNYFGVDSKEAFLSLHLARPLLGQRVLDVLSILNSPPHQPSHGYYLIGVGSAGPIALHAAALDKRITRVEIRDSIASWSDVVDSPISSNQLTNVVPSVLADYDLPDLAPGSRQN